MMKEWQLPINIQLISCFTKKNKQFAVFNERTSKTQNLSLYRNKYLHMLWTCFWSQKSIHCKKLDVHLWNQYTFFKTWYSAKPKAIWREMQTPTHLRNTETFSNWQISKFSNCGAERYYLLLYFFKFCFDFLKVAKVLDP